MDTRFALTSALYLIMFENGTNEGEVGNELQSDYSLVIVKWEIVD